MAHWSVERLIRELDVVVPDWRTISSDPYEAADYYGIEVHHVVNDEGYSELDFTIPNYGDMDDGFDDPD